MSENYQKYDSDSKYINYNTRLAKDAEIRTTSNGEMVRVTFVDTSKAETDEDIWIEATPADNQTDWAKFLKKGDTLPIEGKLTVRKGSQGDKLFFNLRRAILHPSPSMIATLKERGFVPGTAKNGKAAQKNPAAKAPAPTAARKVVNLDDE